MKKWFTLLLLLAAPYVLASTGTIVLDVRTPGEYQQGHVPGALNVEYQVIGKKISSIAPDKKTAIVLYCHSGRRAGLALKQLQVLGYTHVENVGGLADMKKRVSK